jgi:hypothetical protein
MFNFMIRDLLWLTVVVALSLGWFVDSGRINKGVANLEKQRKLLQEDFDDRVQVLDQVQRKASDRLLKSARFGQ